MLAHVLLIGHSEQLMKTSRAETKTLIDGVLNSDISLARKDLHLNLRKMGRGEPDFYYGVLDHCERLPYSSDQWLDFLMKIPVRILHDDPILMSKLSETQREKLRLR